MMARSPRSEENYPLLLLFLEDGNRSPRKRGLFIDNRYSKISDGAGNIVSQWPAQVSNTFWLFASIFTILIIILLLVFAMGTVHHLGIAPRCISYDIKENDTKIFLVHYGTWQNVQFSAIEDIIKNYQNTQIVIISLRNTSQHMGHKRSTSRHVRKKDLHDLKKLEINIGTKSDLKNLKSPAINLTNSAPIKRSRIRTIHELLRKYPIITFRNETMSDFFSYTPLYGQWIRLNIDLVEFAARSIMLWELGGISFKLPRRVNLSQQNQAPNKKMQVYSGLVPYAVPMDEQIKFEAFVKTNISTFKALPKKVVNIDDDAIHMETKTPCHAFFGEILVNLRKASWNTTVNDLVTKTLKTFCLSGAVDDSYCLTILTS